MPSTFRSFVSRWLAFGALWPATACGQGLPPTKRMQPYQKEKFVLTAGPCAADGYWATIQSGVFLCSDGKGIAVPSGHTLEGNWGASGTTWSSGDDMHPAPERLSILWMSYAEDKFYKGVFDLPQERIYQLLKQGSWDLERKKHTTFNELTVCVLPKGGVAVWLQGGNQLLIGRYQAAEYVPSPDEFRRYYGGVDRHTMVRNTWAEMPADVQAEIKAGTVSARRWDEYLTPYPWKVEFAHPFKLYEHATYYVSAEYTINPLTPDPKGMEAYFNVVLAPSPKPLPEKLLFYGQDEAGHRHLVRVKQFDQAELRAAAEQLLKEHPGAPLTFYFAVNKWFDRGTLVLKNEWREVPLAKAAVEALSED